MTHPTQGEIRPNSATPAAVPALNSVGIKAAVACIDGHLDGLRQAIAPAVASLPDGDHPIIWINHNLAVCAYELQEALHAAELLEDGAAMDREAGQ